MHKQHPQTAYRKDAVLTGTIFENCDKINEPQPIPPGKGCGSFLCTETQAAVEEATSEEAASEDAASLETSEAASEDAASECSLRGSAVLLGHGRGRSSLRLSGSRSSLRGRSSSRRRAAAGSHADSQNQSSNGNTNILEFHIKNLLTFEKTVSRKAVQVKPFRKKIF